MVTTNDMILVIVFILIAGAFLNQFIDNRLLRKKNTEMAQHIELLLGELAEVSEETTSQVNDTNKQESEFVSARRKMDEYYERYGFARRSYNTNGDGAQSTQAATEADGMTDSEGAIVD